MRKKKISKVIVFTLCFTILTSVVASAATTSKKSSSRTLVRCELDPNPHETNPPY